MIVIHTYVHHAFIHILCMYIYIHIYIYMYIRIYIHACMYAYVHTYIHTYTNTYIHPHMHSCIRFGVARQTENYQFNGHNFKICLSNMTLCKFQMLGKGEQILVSVKKRHVKTSELIHTQKPLVKSSLRKKFAEPGQGVVPHPFSSKK